ncbi:hypothetical protein ACFWF3_02855 [Nocardia sp. NPDC060220]|uniref:hypothetical protein n=1 Tax=Nocardia sp. NPDC060220 TaxID=3347076 RepID=UPI00365EF393
MAIEVRIPTILRTYTDGFWVVEAPDLDAALKIAARASKVCEQKIEIRTFDGA